MMLPTRLLCLVLAGLAGLWLCAPRRGTRQALEPPQRLSAASAATAATTAVDSKGLGSRDQRRALDSARTPSEATAGRGDVSQEAASPSEVPPEQEPFESELPPDPIELGESALHLFLIDAHTLQAISSQVWLIRLDAPGNELFERGDQRQAEAFVPLEGAWFEQLPEGRYRVISAEEACTPEVPESFELRGATTHQRLRIERAGQRMAWLFVLDPRGTALERVELARLESESISSSELSVAWLVPRKPKVEGFSVTSFESLSLGSPPAPVFAWRTAEARGFELGLIQQNKRQGRYVHHFLARRAGLTEVRCDFSLEDSREIELVALMAPLDELLDQILLPDGRTGRDVRAFVQASCQAVPHSAEQPPEAWRTLRVQVRVQVPEHEPLSFSWRPAAGPPEVRVLEPR